MLGRLQKVRTEKKNAWGENLGKDEIYSYFGMLWIFVCFVPNVFSMEISLFLAAEFFEIFTLVLFSQSILVQAFL